jgi:RNA polymerase sigma-70 factor (ECF subfamily)
MGSDMSDQSGVEDEIRAFLTTEYAKVVAAISLVTGQRQAAEDAVAEALARAWDRSARGETIDSLAAWVTRVALNLARSRWRRLRAEARARRRLAAPEVDDGSSTDRRLDVERALSALPRRQREATVLRYYLGLNVAEIAATLGVTDGTVKTSLHRARSALAEALSLTDPEETNDHAQLG